MHHVNLLGVRCVVVAKYSSQVPDLDAIAELVLSGQVPADWTRIGQDRGLASTLWKFVHAGRPLIAKHWDTSRHGRLEIEFYQRFAHDAGIAVPEFFGTWEADPLALLILVEVTDVELGDCLIAPSRAQLIALTRALAQFHRRWLGFDFWPDVPELTHEWLASRRTTFLKKYGDRLRSKVVEELNRIEDTYAEARAALADCPHAMLHGDFHLDNVLFRRKDNMPVLLDWSRVRRGPFALELARLLDSMAPAALVDELAAVYLGERPEVAHDLERHLHWARKINFIYSTCGMANFEPNTVRERALMDRELARL